MAAAHPCEPPGARSRLIGASPREILFFAARALAWAVVSFALWFAAAKPTSLATSWIAARFVEAATSVGEARIAWREERVVFEMRADASTLYRYRLPADLEVDMAVNALKQTYGVPFFLALLAAARARRFLVKAAMGATILTLLAALGIGCEVAIGWAGTQAPGAANAFATGAVTGTLLALGFQLGTLIFPSVVPAALCVGMCAQPQSADGPASASADSPGGKPPE